MTGSDHLSAAEVATMLDLRPLPVEGGMFAQTFADEHGSGIYFLVASPEFSAMHVLDTAEVYHHYAGAPLAMLLLLPDGRVETPVLGRDLRAGQRPQLRVPPGVWQGSSSTGAWSLVGTTLAPPWRDEAVTFAGREELTVRWPRAAARIAELTRG
jgi:predicted cupin superfamily sugar epimerase